MMWIGLIVGAVIGGLIGELPGAVTFGFLGWLAGLIITSQRRTPGTPVPGTGQVPGTGSGQVPGAGTGPVPGTGSGQAGTRYVPGTGGGGAAVDHSAWRIEDRVAWLERRVVALEGRLAAGVTTDATEAAAAIVPGPIGESAPMASQPQPKAAEAGSTMLTPESAPGATHEPSAIGETAPPAPPSSPSSQASSQTSSPPHSQRPSQPPAQPPVEPPPPNPVIAWLTGGNTIARAGLLILFIGLAFLLKYAADQRLFPPELRIAAVAAGGIALLAIGWRLRLRNEGYALGMQGAGVAVLYLTTFGALRLYGLIPPELAFFLLAGIAVFSAILAVRQDAVALAVIGAGGGFLAPILASTGKGSHVMLFSYYLVLNLGILGIAWFKAWRSLNLTGFAFTFAIFWLWGYRSYTPEQYASTQPFLVAFFVLYVALAILVARDKPTPTPVPGTGQVPVPGLGQVTVPGSGQVPGTRVTRYVDGTLVFGVPLAAFALQAELVGDTEYGLAISALVTAAFYLGLAWRLLRTASEHGKLLAQSFVALGVVFATVAIPLALDARWTSASWAAEGVAIQWVSLKQQRRAGRWFGLLLQLLAAGAYFHAHTRHGDYAIADAAFLGAAFIALAGLWAHRLLLRNRDAIGRGEAMLITPIFIWGVLWLLGAGLDEIDAHVPGHYSLAVALAFVAAIAHGFGLLARRWQWREAAWTAQALLPAMFLAAALMSIRQPHPMGGGGWLAWPYAFAVLAWILRRVVDAAGSGAEAAEHGPALHPAGGRDADVAGTNDVAGTTDVAGTDVAGTRYVPGTGVAGTGVASALHAGAAILLALVGAVELNWIAARYTAHGTAWSSGAVAVWPSLVLLVVCLARLDARWPIAAHPRPYRLHAAGVIAAMLAAWSLFANVTHDARSDPLPYMPLINALDLAHVFAILTLVAAWRAALRSGIEPPEGSNATALATLGGAVGFVWLTAILLRTVSHWGGVPYTQGAMMSSVLVQASLSIFWALLALAAMILATRTARRAIWIVGAVLMGVVVAKLFLVDLGSVGTIARIVSFIAVGVLMLVIGYFSPVPPRKPESQPQ